MGHTRDSGVEKQDLVKEACRLFHGHVMIGIDARDGLAAVEGWTEKQVRRQLILPGATRKMVRTQSFTPISKGTAWQRGSMSKPRWRDPFHSRGRLGVAGIEDIRSVAGIEADGVMGVIVGKALIYGKLRLPEATGWQRIGKLRIDAGRWIEWKTVFSAESLTVRFPVRKVYETDRVRPSMTSIPWRLSM